MSRTTSLPASFVRFVQIFSEQTVTSLKSSALVAFPVHLVLLSFGKEYKKRLIQSGHSVVAFLPSKAVRREGRREADNEGDVVPLYGYSASSYSILKN